MIKLSFYFYYFLLKDRRKGQDEQGPALRSQLWPHLYRGQGTGEMLLYTHKSQLWPCLYQGQGTGEMLLLIQISTTASSVPRTRNW